MEQYVTYKTAMQLKMVGYDEKCESFYDENKKLKFWDSRAAFSNSQFAKFAVAAPSQSEANRWLREKQKYHIMAPPKKPGKWIAAIYMVIPPNKFDGKLNAVFLEEKEYGTYEKAVEAGLQFVLKTLIDAQKKYIKNMGNKEMLERLKKELEEAGFDLNH